MLRSVVVLLCLCASLLAHGRPTTSDIEAEISAGLPRVIEFRAIRDKAKELGIRVWLFGGTAAAYAHYARWSMLSRAGEAGLQKERFDDDFTNIFRSNQDLDLVVDGPMEGLLALERWIQETFPYAQGNKSDWELRHLRLPRGTKMPLDGKDFLGQHTDSHSTGLIELSDPPEGESRVSDLRDPLGKPPIFLRDVAAVELHYYFSPTHHETSRARDGLNPPIISAIRYLTKMFQYELAVNDDELAVVAEIVKQFDPRRVPTGYVADWIERNATKLFQNAVNIEYAWDILEKLGLRNKLIAIKGNANTAGSLAWWLQREPLRSFEVGQGRGATAESLGLDYVTHETRSFLAHESITRAHSGHPNVFISRQGKPEESAFHGDGFYARVGMEGAVGSRIKVRCRLKPHAREGKDFKYIRSAGCVVILNKNAVEVMPEILNLSPVEYLDLLLNDETLPENERALVEKFRRRTRGRLRLVPAEERAPLEQKILAHALTKSVTPLIEYVRMFGGLPESLGARMNAAAPADRLKLLEKIAAQGVPPKELEPWVYRLLYDDGEIISVESAHYVFKLHEKSPMPVEDLWRAWVRIPPEDWQLYPRKVWETLVKAKRVSEGPPTGSEEVRLGWAIRKVLAWGDSYAYDRRYDFTDALQTILNTTPSGVPERFERALYRAMTRSLDNEWLWIIVRRAGRYGDAFYEFLGDALTGAPFPEGESLRTALDISEKEWEAGLLRAAQAITLRPRGTNLSRHIRKGSAAARAYAARRYARLENNASESDHIIAYAMRQGADSPELLEAVLAKPRIQGSPLWEHLKYLAGYLRSDDRALRQMVFRVGHDGYYERHTGYELLRPLFVDDPGKLDAAWAHCPADPWATNDDQSYVRGLLITAPESDPRRFALAVKLLQSRPPVPLRRHKYEEIPVALTTQEAIRALLTHPRRHEVADAVLAMAAEVEGEFAREHLKTFLTELDEAAYRRLLLSDASVDVFKIPVRGDELRRHPKRAEWVARLMTERATAPVPWRRLVELTTPSDPWGWQLAAEGMASEFLNEEIAGPALSLLEARQGLDPVVVEPLLAYVGNPKHLPSHAARGAKLFERFWPGRPDLELRIQAIAERYRKEIPKSDQRRTGVLAALDPVWKQMRTARLGSAPIRWCSAALRAAGLLGPEPAVSAPPRPATEAAAPPP